MMSSLSKSEFCLIRLYSSRPSWVPSFITKWTRSSSSRSSPKSASPDFLINHKDWLSPNEVVKIFQTLEDPTLAISAFNEISKRKDYRPTEAVYTSVITKLAQAKHFDAIEELMQRIKIERSCRLSDDFFYHVIKIYGHLAGRINRAIETLFDMPNYKCWPTIKTFNFVLNLLVSTKQFDIIHEVYMGASKLGVEIDACCLNILIKGLCGCGDLNGALQLLDEFPKQHCKPNVRTYSTLMHGLFERRRFDEAFGLFERMEKEGIELDTIAYNTLIWGMRKQGGKVEEGVELLRRMRFKGCEPNEATYQEVVYGLLEGKKFVEAKDFMDRMMSTGGRPSYDSFKLLINGLCSQGLVEDVNWAVKKMVCYGYAPKKGMWAPMIRLLMVSRNRSNNELLLEEIIGNG
ncbi:pentatricopeptide repeat-containing protein At3g14580, mitochondrial [Impatiens glandulifera]|uniref:pentatricopeptide repeat-containing protein At3g14580, mitochondrial n=1 Tax=Impatiens glandulifera TaxID=253017 RepID=UPI001FB0E9BF|nr:pentatricopeptide repeat-containing protein At3g14580, mitochondrial [Impatiens glandulifera]